MEDPSASSAAKPKRSRLQTRIGRVVASRRIFPFLAAVRLMRTYCGFRPYCPDHLPVIGPDPRVPGVFHACGHEGAGIGLAPGTGALISELLTGGRPDLPAFAPARFA